MIYCKYKIFSLKLFSFERPYLLTLIHFIIWKKKHIPADMYAQWRFRSSCAFAQSNIKLHWVQGRKLSLWGQQSLWSDCRNAMADLSLRWANMSEGTLGFIFSLISSSKTCLYNIDPLKPHFYIVKLGFTGVYIMFLISAQKHRLWVLVRTASPRRF